MPIRVDKCPVNPSTFDLMTHYKICPIVMDTRSKIEDKSTLRLVSCRTTTRHRTVTYRAWKDLLERAVLYHCLGILV